jgi:hypothetical protein
MVTTRPTPEESTLFDPPVKSVSDPFRTLERLVDPAPEATATAKTSVRTSARKRVLIAGQLRSPPLVDSAPLDDQP